MSLNNMKCLHCGSLLSECTTTPAGDTYCAQCRQVVADVSVGLAELEATALTPSPAREGGTLCGRASLEGAPVELVTTSKVEVLPAIEVPGFEMLDVLGRGGMGVVYKARHLKLNRLVALKMIVTGDHAGPEQIERLVAEARAVARLQHPHIVQIHEIGEHKGLPYLALEFVAGGSLAQQWGRAKQDPDAVALLVETLARAMHVAHQQGIIHRDLKPANILLGADGAPKINDFGLAKQASQDAGAEQTRIGAILGTPAYMAPEQAQGDTHNIGPATDVYALGVILYAGLTGHPPFVGDSVMQTLHEVIAQEPAPPSKNVPGVPRDLETICLKCLQKAPPARYASAEALAEDLRRFRQGEPIRARRVGLGERAWKWVWRRPTAAALIGVTFLVAVLAETVLLMRDRADQVQDRSDRVGQITRLSADLEAGLTPAGWTAEHLAHMDAMIAELDRLDPQLAGPLRQRLTDRFVASIRDSFSIARKAVFHPDDAPPIEAMLNLLEPRQPREADKIRKELDNRLRRRQLAMNLQPPFTEAAALFPRHRPEIGPQGLRLHSHNAAPGPVIMAEMPCTRHAEMEVIFQDDQWNVSGPVGVVLNAGKDQGYFFYLRAPQTAADDEDLPAEGADLPKRPPPRERTLAEMRESLLSLQLYRNQQRLREWLVPAAEIWPKGNLAAPIRMRIERAEGLLTLRCNNAQFAFEDAMPLTAQQDGVFAVYLPPSTVRVQSMRAWILHKPKAPSPLQRGDELFAQGQFTDAQVEYHLQAQAGADAKIRQEAEYKQALCMLAGKDSITAAIELLENVVKEGPDERWNALATCQLWAVRVEQGKRPEANLIFQSLRDRYGIKDLNLYLPDYLRDRVLGHYRSYYQSSIISQMERPGFVADYERALAIEEYFHTPLEQRTIAKFYLFRAYVRGRQYDKALQTARALFKEMPTPTADNRVWWHTLWEEYALLMRVENKTDAALKELDRDLFVLPGVQRADCQPLLIERACLLASLKRFPDAESNLDEFFRQMKPGDYPARFWTRACLMRGFLRQRRGDQEGALAAWKLGLPSSDPGLAWLHDRITPMALAQTAILCSLCDALPDNEVEVLTGKLFSQFGIMIAAGAGLKTTVQALLPELAPKNTGPVLRAMWRTEEGQRIAQQVAFRERPLPELYRTVLGFGFVRLGHRVMEPHHLTKEDDQLLRHFGDDLYTTAITGKINTRQLISMTPLIFSWRNLPSFSSFDTATRALDPPLRGPLAYFFGLRYRHIYGNEKEAAAYFNRALRAAPPESQVHQLAKAALLVKN